MSRVRGAAGAGFSLVEVVVAMGLVAGVLISIAGMLVLGSRQVKSGRTSSEALAVARDVLERIESWSFRQTYERLGCNENVTICEVPSAAGGEAASWHERLARTLTDSGATIRLDGLAADGTPTALGAAHAIRVKVLVFWSEGPRDRRIELATVRM